MPKIVPMSERQAFKVPEPEPEKYTLLEHFDLENDLVEVTPILFTSLYQRIEKLQIEDLNKFVSQAILDLIQAAKGLVRTEPEKHPCQWYTREQKVKGKAQIKYEGLKQTIVPRYTTIRTVARKQIPIPAIDNVVITVPVHADQKTAIVCEIPGKLNDEAYRLSQYWQMSFTDLLLQAIELAVYKVEGKELQKQASANTNRLNRFRDWDDRQQESTLNAVAKRLAKNSQAPGGTN